MTEIQEGGKQIPLLRPINRTGPRETVVYEELIPKEATINEAGQVERAENFIDAMRGHGHELVEYIDNLDKVVARNPNLKQESTIQEAGALLHLMAMNVNAIVRNNTPSEFQISQYIYHGDTPHAIAAVRLTLPGLIQRHSELLSDSQIDKAIAHLERIKKRKT